jgi:multimeric flavodoxin WrbA
MKIASILGSPRRQGNTSRVMQWIEDALRGQSHEIDRINIVDFKVNGCKGCFTCKKVADSLGCPQKDDAMEIMSRLMTVDTILYGSPIYFWGPTSQMKALIDRHCSLVTGFGTAQWQSLLEGKRLGLLVTCEDAVENNVDLMEEFYRRLARYLKCDHAGALVIPFTTTPDRLDDRVREQAHAFASRLVAVST